MLPYRKRRTRTKTRRIRRLEEEKNVSECVSTANRSSAFLISFFFRKSYIFISQAFLHVKSFCRLQCEQEVPRNRCVFHRRCHAVDRNSFAYDCPQIIFSIFSLGRQTVNNSCVLTSTPATRVADTLLAEEITVVTINGVCVLVINY